MVMIKNVILLTAIFIVGCGGADSTSSINDSGSDNATNNIESNTDNGTDNNTDNTNNSPPVITPANLTSTITAQPNNTTSNRYAKFEFSAPDATSYECKMDTNAFVACESGVFFEDVGQGSHTFNVRAIGENGAMGATVEAQWDVNSVLSNNNDNLIVTNFMPDAVAPNSWKGIIRINCDFAHSSYNDPIVFPNQENAAHLHRFYGNTEVDHTTTLESLYTVGESSCQGNTLNLSGYWVPALLAPSFNPTTKERMVDEKGDPAWKVVPAVVGNDDEAHEVFYYSAGIDNLNEIQPVPAGLRIIAGEHATMPGETQDSTIIRWHCQSWESDDATNPQFSASIPECVAPDRVRMDIFFPSCWDGINLDSQNHKSHMAYPVKDSASGRTICPNTHPVAIARPSYHYAFGVKPDVFDPTSRSSRGWRIASDMYEVSQQSPGGLSLHADWFNGWHPEIMELIVSHCIQQGLDCHDGNLANGYRLSGTREGTQEEPEIHNKGMRFDTSSGQN